MFSSAEALLLLLNNPLYSDCGFAEIFKYDIWIPCFYSHPTGIGLKQPPLFSVTTYRQVRTLLFRQVLAAEFLQCQIIRFTAEHYRGVDERVLVSACLHCKWAAPGFVRWRALRLEMNRRWKARFIPQRFLSPSVCESSESSRVGTRQDAGML